MSEEIFLLPDVGEGLIEAEIVTWKVKVGDVVALNQPLVDVETAKAVVELPSPFVGTVLTLHGQEGETMEVNAPLVTFDVGGEPAPHANEKQVVHDVPDEQRREPVLIGYGVANEESLPSRRSRRRPARDGEPVIAAAPRRGAVRTTPPVRLLAKQWGIDLETLTGTGRDGLVTRDDLERAHRQSTPVTTSVARNVASTRTSDSSRFVGREIAPWSTGAREERFAVKGVLKAMADAMLQSTTQQPQAVVWVRTDVTKTMELLGSLKAHPHLAGVRISPLTFIALAVCDAARHYPGINSSFDATANEVIVRRYMNLGIAADTARGLIVPNIKDADQLDLRAMATALSSLVATAREGTTTPADMLGTTFTITNVGPFKVDAAMAILPPGTGAILCVGQIAKAPWVHHDELCVRDVLELSMTFDHRQIDGALASRVLAHIAGFLEDPATSLLAQ
ncbi:MAG: dihydrolipoamide acetyltransferase family protein [Actinomycetota bacterium]|nr:dihydrolipoamide acetyltransferase family protein [Actinomycetota bacterium]